MTYEGKSGESKDPVDLGIDEKFITEVLVEFNRGDFGMYASNIPKIYAEAQPVLFRFAVRNPDKQISTLELSRGLDVLDNHRITQDLDREQESLMQSVFENARIFGEHDDIMMQMAALEAEDNYYKILGGMIVLQTQDENQHEQAIVVYPELYTALIRRYSEEIAPDSHMQTPTISGQLSFEEDYLAQRKASACLSLLLLNTFYDQEQTHRAQLC